MKRVILVVLGVATAAAAWFLWGQGGGGGARPGDGSLSPDPAGEEGRSEAESAKGPDATLAPGRERAGGGRPRRAAADAPKGGGAVVGTVRRDGAPAQARVELRFLLEADESSLLRGGGAALFDMLLAAPPSASPAAATARAGADGRFAFEGLGKGLYGVTAVAEDGARGAVQAVLSADGVRIEANPVLVLGSETLRGRAVHADGRPWKGLVVVVPSSGGRGFDEVFLPDAAPVAVTVDAEGRFTATGLAPGAVTVSAVDPGALRVVGKPVTLPHEGEYVLTVDAAFGVVDGTVVADADGSPIAGADVLAGGQAAGVQFAIGRTTTDAQGKFRLPVPKGRESGLIARATGYASVMMERPDTDKPTEVRLTRGARVSGRVTLEGSGKPVAGASVSAATKDGDRGPFAPEPGTTDADGRYEVVDLPAGDATLVATGPGIVTKGVSTRRDDGWNPNAVTLEAGKTVTLDLLVVPGARAQGTVVDAQGKPVAGASVAAEAAEGRGPRGGIGLFGGSGTVAASGADGSFTFDTLTAGDNYTFVATAPGHGPGRAGPVTANDAGPVNVTVKLGLVRTLVVTALDEGSGQPVPGARVMANGPSPSNVRRPPMAVTDREGKALLGPLEEGAVRVSVEAEGYVRSRETNAGANDTTLTVRLERGAEVAGRVRRADGTPVLGASVTIQSPGTWLRESTAADGSFRFRGVSRTEGITLHVSARDEDGTTLSTTQEVRAGATDVVVTLERGAGAAAGALTVRVFGADGKPVPRAEARFVSEGSSYGTNVRDGEVRFENLRDRVAGYVEVWGAKARDGSPLPYGPARVGPVAPTTSDLDVRLPAEAAVSGVVRTPDGRGLRGVAVTAAVDGSEGSRSWGNEHASVRTAEDGTFRLGGLDDREYTLRFQTPPDFVAPDRVTASGGTSGLVVSLRVAAKVTIRVLDPAGQPVVGASVTARPPGSNDWDEMTKVTTDASGSARLAGLDATKAYTLVVEPPAGRDDWKGPSPWANWMPKDETIRLERSYVVKGVVRDLAGNPVGRAMVLRMVEGGGWTGSGAEEDGTFTIRGLTAGPVQLRAQVSGGPQAEEPATTTVQAGDTSVVLRLDVGLELRVTVENWGGQRWAQASLFVEAEGGPKFAGNQSITPGREARFRGLKAGTAYTLWVGPTEDGRYGLVTGLRAPGEPKVTLQVGKTITVRVLAPPGATGVGANASMFQGHASLHGRALPDGRFELRGAPDGTSWNVRAWAKVGEQNWSGEAAATAGGTVDVELKAPGDGNRPSGR